MKTTPELLALYTSQLDNITKILLDSGAKHVLYALTTPFEADAQPDCGSATTTFRSTLLVFLRFPRCNLFCPFLCLIHFHNR
jgi:hypothetical protein